MFLCESGTEDSRTRLLAMSGGLGGKQMVKFLSKRLKREYRPASDVPLALVKALKALAVAEWGFAFAGDEKADGS